MECSAFGFDYSYDDFTDLRLNLSRFIMIQMQLQFDDRVATRTGTCVEAVKCVKSSGFSTSHALRA